MASKLATVKQLETLQSSRTPNFFFFGKIIILRNSEGRVSMYSSSQTRLKPSHKC